MTRPRDNDPRTAAPRADGRAPRVQRMPGLLLTLLGALCTPLAATALTTDREKPIEIEADNAEADNARMVTIYKGDVIIIQGSLRIAGDTVTVHFDENFDITKAVTEGRPSTFRQLPDGETEYRTARARRMEYHAKKDLIVLLGDAQYGKGESRLRADRIEYDSLNSRVRAETDKSRGDVSGGDGSGSGRVRIKIQPSSSKSP